jgi:hemerythrin-like domain-containing protein
MLSGAELPGFNDPLGVLRACHQRILARCDTLEKLPAHLAAKGADSEARSAIGQIINYFSSSAVHHHQDEEIDLFPILSQQSLQLAATVSRLQQEHTRLDALWAALAAALEKPDELPNNAQLTGLIQRFCALNRAHVDCENREVLSMAQHILNVQQIEELGAAMARRRGLHRS